ncbi:anthranilate synthase component I family protein [Streptomyces sp. NPDC056486]|uniref:anthranilate synthase component I family protein n=1 Tax=Streptomyces sp. NPDC056486 TaxID=3345835 RepID=UPI0036CDDDB9
MPGKSSATRQVPVRVTVDTLPPHDPLRLVTHLQEEAGAQNVFLLEGYDGSEERRTSAVVGSGRIAEIRVFGSAEGGGTGRVEVEGAPLLSAALAGEAVRLGLTRQGPAGGFRFSASRQMWDLLEASQRLFAVETDVPLSSFAFGFLTSLSYESTWLMEDLPPRTGHPEGPDAEPDVVLTLFRETLWYDTPTGAVRRLRAESDAFPASREPDLLAAARATAVSGAEPEPVPDAPAPLSVHDSVDKATFLGWAERCLEHIRVGDIYQIQIGHRVDVRTTLAPGDVYRRLRRRNPSPHMYLAPRAESLLIGASPELFLRISDGEIVMRPIAGTTRRGPDEEENERRIKEMQASTKERAEHIMLVDLCRNDIGRVSEPSTRPVDDLMYVEAFSHVFHLVSTVSGRLAEGVGVWDAVRAAFPAGTMTGAPKIRAMEIINELEAEPRNAYAGAVGLVDARGAWSELALCIRTVTYDGTTYSTQTSAGMVAQSDPEAEWQETLTKMGASYWALTGKELW